MQYTGNTTTVTVKAGQSLTLNINGYLIRYEGGETVKVPTAIVAGLQQAGVVN